MISNLWGGLTFTALTDLEFIRSKLGEIQQQDNALDVRDILTSFLEALGAPSNTHLEASALPIDEILHGRWRQEGEIHVATVCSDLGIDDTDTDIPSFALPCPSLPPPITLALSNVKESQDAQEACLQTYHCQFRRL